MRCGEPKQDMITEGRDGGYIPKEELVSVADEYINELGKGIHRRGPGICHRNEQGRSSGLHPLAE